MGAPAGPLCSSEGPSETYHCGPVTALNGAFLEALAMSTNERPPGNTEAPQCVPLLGPLSGLDWAGGQDRFASWESCCGALRGLLRGPWRAGETIEFLGAEAEPPRQVRGPQGLKHFVHQAWPPKLCDIQYKGLEFNMCNI